MWMPMMTKNTVCTSMVKMKKLSILMSGAKNAVNITATAVNTKAHDFKRTSNQQKTFAQNQAECHSRESTC